MVMSTSTRPGGTSNRALSAGIAEPEPTPPSRPSNSVVPVTVRALSATTAGADTARDLGVHEITIRARPSGSLTSPTHASIAGLRRSARRDIGSIDVDADASIARHSDPSGDQYPGRACITRLRRLARISTVWKRPSGFAGS